MKVHESTRWMSCFVQNLSNKSQGKQNSDRSKNKRRQMGQLDKSHLICRIVVLTQNKCHYIQLTTSRMSKSQTVYLRIIETLSAIIKTMRSCHLDFLRVRKWVISVHHPTSAASSQTRRFRHKKWAKMQCITHLAQICKPRCMIKVTVPVCHFWHQVKVV